MCLCAFACAVGFYACLHTDVCHIATCTLAQSSKAIACMYVCMYVRTYVRRYVCMHACMYLCRYVYAYTWLYIHILIAGDFVANQPCELV